MVTIIVCFAYYIYLFVGFVKSARFGDDTFPYVICFIIGAIISVLVGYLIARILAIFFTTEEQLSETLELGGLERSAQMSGSFFLGIGNIGETRSYFFYTKNEEGGYVPKSLPVGENISFYEGDDNMQPRMEKYEPSFKKDWMLAIALPGGDEKYNFYVPKGSIKTDYKL